MLNAMKSAGLAAALMALCACAGMQSASDGADARAFMESAGERFVRLTLAVGQHEDGYVDAYYGPEEWADEAQADTRSLDELRAEVEAFQSELAALDAAALSPIERQRIAFMHAQLTAAHARIRMLMDEVLSFDEESQALYGTVAPDVELSQLQPVLDRLEELTPGEGAQHERVDAYLSGFDIPEARLNEVMRAAIDECRARTAAHITLPEGERFNLEFVTDQPWSGYNWYQGGAESLIQVNTDFPVRISRAIDLACHEGYPGHHTLNALLEQRLARERGWVEFMIYPLFSPQSFIAEGTANLGIDMAFPGDERTAFERDVLYPLAGLDPAQAARYSEIAGLVGALWPARIEISRDYLNGDITREEAVELFTVYGLQSRARAEQSVAFTETYRAYVINYGLGQALAAEHIDAVAGADQDARWAEFERLISTPATAADLIRAP